MRRRTYTTFWTPVTSTTLDFPGQSLGAEDYYQPQWIDSSQMLVSHVGQTVTEDQARWLVHTTSDGTAPTTAGTHPAVTGTSAQGVVNRQGTSLAIFSDDAADYLDGKPRSVELFLYSSPNLATAETNGWHLDCTVTLSAAGTTDPYHLRARSFSSDGTKLYWGDDKGVEVATVGDRSDGCANVTPSLLFPGGSEPFVSPRRGAHAGDEPEPARRATALPAEGGLHRHHGTPSGAPRRALRRDRQLRDPRTAHAVRLVLR